MNDISDTTGTSSGTSSSGGTSSGPAAIWRRQLDAAAFAASHADTLPKLLGIRLVEYGPDYLVAEMPVDSRHVQPFGILHGGASVVLAETVGSIAGTLVLDPGETVVGVEINASHLASVMPGDVVRATCRPLRLGRSLQVWTIELRRGDGTLTCVSRLTVAVRRA